jgi:hypothetical protein
LVIAVLPGLAGPTVNSLMVVSSGVGDDIRNSIRRNPLLGREISHIFGYSLVTDRCQKLGIDRGWIDRLRTDVGPITTRTNHLVPP